jgi:hypothetical protein
MRHALEEYHDPGGGGGIVEMSCRGTLSDIIGVVTAADAIGSCEGGKITAATAAVVGGAGVSGVSGYFGEQHTAAAVIGESRTSAASAERPPTHRRRHRRQHTQLQVRWQGAYHRRWGCF